MTILLACAEDCDVESLTGSGVEWTTTAGLFRSGYSRGAFSVLSGSGDGPSNQVTSKPFTAASSEFWVSAQFALSGLGSNNVQMLRFLDASGVCRLLIRSAGSTEVKLCTRTAAGTITDLVTSTGVTLGTNTVRKYDVYVKYAGDGTGVFTLYLNGVQVATYSGANTTDGATQLNKISLCAGGSAGSVYGYWSEVIAATTDTRGMSLALLNSTTAGNAQQWTGTASNVNQNSLTNDSQYIYTDTANELQQYKPAALPTGNWTVHGVVMATRAIRGDTGPQNIQFATRIGSTDYTSASVQPSTAFGNIQNIQETNPGTSTAWIAADLADTNFQYGLKSIT